MAEIHEGGCLCGDLNDVVHADSLATLPPNSRRWRVRFSDFRAWTAAFREVGKVPAISLGVLNVLNRQLGSSYTEKRRR